MGMDMTVVKVAGAEGTVAEAVRPAHSVLSRTRGLMLHAPLAEGEGLDIRPCGSIHMMFMRFPIDAVFYDREVRVTKVATNVKPWVGIAFGGRGAHGVIEMPVGSAADVRAGDVLEFSECGQGES